MHSNPSRDYKTVHVEIKAEAVDPTDGTFTGYGSVFDVVDSYSDIVVQGAFKRTINARKGKIRFLWQHNPNQPVGKFLSLEEDSYGLKVVGKFNLDTQIGREAYAHVKHGDIDGLSIGFYTEKAEDDSARGVRLIKEVKLMETSLVTFPANEEATILQVRSAARDAPAETIFGALTHEQRLKTIAYMRTLSAPVVNNDIESPSLQVTDDPPALAPAEPACEALAAPEPDKEAVGAPPSLDDESFKHALMNLKAAIRAA